MSEFSPLVSIIISVYNGADYLREAIDSALAQTYPDIEIIVVNDGSTDGGSTEVIARSYGEKIRYVWKENGGVASALNVGIREMRGEYFSWLSHDDVYYPEKIAVQMEAVRKIDKPVILYSDLDIINEASDVLYRHRISPRTAGDVIYGLLTRSSVNGCTTLIPKQCLDAVGGFDEKLRTTQDFDLWLRLAKNYDFVHLPAALIKSRVHPQQGSLTISGHRQAENDFYIKALNELPTFYIDSQLHRRGPAFFCALAFHLRRRGFTTAADHARRLAHEQGKVNRLHDLPRHVFWIGADEMIRLTFRMAFIRRAAKRINRVLKVVD